MKLIIYIFLINFLFWFNSSETEVTLPSTVCSCNPEQDSLALVEFFNATNGPTWDSSANWLTPTVPISDWYGVTVNSEGCVICLDLDGGDGNCEQNKAGNKLNGSFQGINLPFLTNLYLSNNNLTGGISSINGFPNLEELIINNNIEFGDTFDGFNHPNIEILKADSCAFQGSLPANLNLPSIEVLSLEKNELTGGIPSFVMMPNLKELNLNKNYNIGGNLLNLEHPNLEVLKANSCAIQGPIYPNLNLPSLIKLYLEGNELNGEISSFPIMTNLEELALSKNPGLGQEILNLEHPNLKILYANECNINSTLTPDLNLPSLTHLYLSKNGLTGSIPQFTNLGNLKVLFINDNISLEGPLPDLSSTPLLETFWASYCGFNGPIHDFSLANNLVVLNLKGNENLTGTIPNFPGPNLADLNLSSCTSLEGPLPLFDNLNLVYFTISNIGLDGTIPSMFPNMHPNLKYFIAHTNNFEGSIPNFSGLQSLEVLRLEQNRFDDVPDMNNIPALGTGWEGFHFENNFLSFKHVLPNLDLPGHLKFHPQKTKLDTTITVPFCSNYTIDLGIDEQVDSNYYIWSINNEVWTITDSNKVTIPQITELTTITCEVHNTVVQAYVAQHPETEELVLNNFKIVVIPDEIKDCNCPELGLVVESIPSNLCEGETSIIHIDNTDPSYNYELYFNGQASGISSQGNGNSISIETNPIEEETLITIIISEIANDDCSFELEQTLLLSPSDLTTETSVVNETGTGADGAITLCLDGGFPPYTITFSPMQGEQHVVSGPCEGNFDITGLTARYYSIEIMDDIGCIFITTILVDNPEKDRIGFPECPLITPNNDGLNDYLVFDGLVNYPENELYIFDRFGNELFHIDNYINNWDGTSKNSLLPQGTYFYTLLLDSTRHLIYKGCITLKYP